MCVCVCACLLACLLAYVSMSMRACVLRVRMPYEHVCAHLCVWVRERERERERRGRGGREKRKSFFISKGSDEADMCFVKF